MREGGEPEREIQRSRGGGRGERDRDRGERDRRNNEKNETVRERARVRERDKRERKNENQRFTQNERVSSFRVKRENEIERDTEKDTFRERPDVGTHKEGECNPSKYTPPSSVPLHSELPRSGVPQSVSVSPFPDPGTMCRL